MKFSLITLAALAPIILAQNAAPAPEYLTSVLAALTGAGLTSLVGVASAIANTTEGQALLGQLSQGNKTVFAPNNEAFGLVPQNVSSNTTLLTRILAYHIVNTTVTANGIQVSPNHTIARTALTGGTYALPANRSQPLVLTRSNATATSFQVIQNENNVTVNGPGVMAANLMVYVIPSVLSLPPTINELAQQRFPALAGIIEQSGLLGPIASSRGITVFAPNDGALTSAQALLANLNTTQVQQVLANHVINGTAVYENQLRTGNYTSAGGQNFMFVSNATGTYVMSGNSTARVIRSDLVTNNGVVHVIDQVLANPATNPSAASSAYVSATSAAVAAPNTQGPLTATSMMSPSGSGGAASSSRAAGDLVANMNIFHSFFAAAVGVVGVVVGGGLVLA